MAKNSNEQKLNKYEVEKEFYNYVDSFDKVPGTYTKEEIIKIGMAHKALPRNAKDWKKLAEYVGYSSGDAYKKFIQRYIQKSLSIHDVVTDRIIDEVSNKNPQVTTSMFQKQKAELYKEKQKVRDILNEYKALLRHQSREETLKEFIQSALEKVQKYERKNYVFPKSKDNVEAILMFSDLHIGVECDNFYNTYNVDVARERVAKLTEKTIKYCQDHKVQRLNVVNLGDLIHGLIHNTARIEQQYLTVEQTMVAADIVGEMLYHLQQAAPEVIYRSVIDNHGRTVADKRNNIEADNFGRIIDWYLRETLKDTKIKFALDNLDFDLGKFTLLNGKNVVFAHGHNDSINRSFENFIGATQEFVHYGLIAHYHSEKMKSFQGFKIFVNGSIVGSEQYAVTNRLFGKPSQTLLIFEGNDVINHSISLE